MTPGCENCACILAALKDPTSVHANMLRGIIAPITVRQAAHIAGEAMVTWLNEVEALNPPPAKGFSMNEKPCWRAVVNFHQHAFLVGFFDDEQKAQAEASFKARMSDLPVRSIEVDHEDGRRRRQFWALRVPRGEWYDCDRPKPDVISERGV